MIQPVLKFFSRPLPTVLVVALHGVGAVAAFLAAVLYSIAGLDWWSSFYAMTTCLWVMTLGFRLIERFQGRGR